MQPRAAGDDVFSVDDLMSSFGKTTFNAKEMKNEMRGKSKKKVIKQKRDVSDTKQKKKGIDWNTLNQEVFDELNKVRLDPQCLIPRLKFILDHMKNGKYYAPNQQKKGHKIGLIYKEKDIAIKEAIEHLKKQKKRRPLTLSTELSKAASFHVEDQGKDGGTGHIGSDGRKPAQRMIAEPENDESSETMGWISGCGENIMYGRRTGRDVVCALIIDDGVKSRGHRDNMFSDEWTMVGIASGPHPKYRTMCVLDFAIDYGRRSLASDNQDLTDGVDESKEKTED